jgi:hypothetical protein
VRRRRGSRLVAQPELGGDRRHRHVWAAQEDDTSLGSYETYRLNGSATPSSIPADSRGTTAIAVCDFRLFLLLGGVRSTGERSLQQAAGLSSGPSGSSS